MNYHCQLPGLFVKIIFHLSDRFQQCRSPNEVHFSTVLQGAHTLYCFYVLRFCDPDILRKRSQNADFLKWWYISQCWQKRHKFGKIQGQSGKILWLILIFVCHFFMFHDQGSKIRVSSCPRRPKNEWGQPEFEMWLSSWLPDSWGVKIIWKLYVYNFFNVSCSVFIISI